VRLLNALAISGIVYGCTSSTIRSSDKFSNRLAKTLLDIFGGRSNCYNCRDETCSHAWWSCLLWHY